MTTTYLSPDAEVLMRVPRASRMGPMAVPDAAGDQPKYVSCDFDSFFATWLPKAISAFVKPTMKPIKTKDAVWANDPDNELHINFAALGQGDGIFIKTPLGRTIMVDYGSKKKEDHILASIGESVFEKGLMSYDYNTIDFVIVTHPDEDHYNLILPILLYQNELRTKIPMRRPVYWPFPLIRRILYSGDLRAQYGTFGLNVAEILATKKQYQSTFPKKTYPSRPDVALVEKIILNDSTPNPQPILLLEETLASKVQFKMSVLAAGVRFDNTCIDIAALRKQKRLEADEEVKDKLGKCTNALSIVILLEFGNDKILLTGDANSAVEKFLLKHFEQQLKGMTLVQIPHHGALDFAFSNKIVSLMKSVLVVGSAPFTSSNFGHPRYTTLKTFAQHAGVWDLEGQEPTNKVICYHDNPAAGKKDNVRKIRRGNSGSQNIKPTVKLPDDFEVTRDVDGHKITTSSGTQLRGILSTDRYIAVTGSLQDLTVGGFPFGTDLMLSFSGL